MYALTSNFAFALVSLLVSALTSILAVYDVNCVFVGTCNAWGWIKTVLFAIMSIVSLFMYYELYKVKKMLSSSSQK